MPCPMHSYDLQNFCLSRFSCPFLQRKAPSRWPALIQKAHPSTSNTPHFETYLRRIFVYILLIVIEGLQSRVGLAQKAHPSTSNTPHFETYLRRIFVYILLIVMESLQGTVHACIR